MRYAHISSDSGNVIEVIEDVERQQVPAPEPLPEDASAEQQANHDHQQALHDAFEPGIVPLSERFHADLVPLMIPIPEGVDVQPGYVFDGKTFNPPPPPPTYEPAPVDMAEKAREMVHEALNKGAKAWGFMHMDNALTYLYSRVAGLNQDAQALLSWRDKVHEWEAEFVPSVLKGEAKLPDTSQALADALPPLPPQPSKQSS